MMSRLDKIPAELRALNQWVVVGPDKLPLQPSGYAADPTNPSTWSSFEACAPFLHVGFCLSEDDPFTIIDMDTKGMPYEDFQRISWDVMQAFDSYAEFSFSGSGIHIIVRGSIGSGRRNKNLEIYSSARYMICTGDVAYNAPVAERQSILEDLVSRMPNTANTGAAMGDQLLSDEEVVRLMATHNADKFEILWNGQLELAPEYPSHSEMDLGLMNLIVYYSRNREQAERIYGTSPLGQRAKASPRKIQYALNKAISAQVPPVDIATLAPPVVESLPDPQPEKQPDPIVEKKSEKQHEDTSVYPAGLLGELCRYFYSSTIRPVEKAALVASLGFFASLVGREFQSPTRAPLNHYLIYLAKSGSGKESLNTNLGSLYATLSQQQGLNELTGFELGWFTSANSMHGVLNSRPCGFSYVDEISEPLKRMLGSGKGIGAESTLKEQILKLYNTTSLTALNYTSKEKSLDMISRPALTIIGGSVPDVFYKALTQDEITSGLVARFTIIEHTGLAPKEAYNRVRQAPESLLARLRTIAAYVLQLKHEGRAAVEAKWGPGVEQVYQETSDWITDNKINGGSVFTDIWTRAALKISKLSGLLAVAENHLNPVVTMEQFQWAKKFVYAELDAVVKRFERGEAGSDEDSAVRIIRTTLSTYIKKQSELLAAHKGVKETIVNKDTKAFAHSCIFKAFIQQRVANRPAFKEHPAGAAKGLDIALKTLVESGELMVCPPAQVAKQLNSSATCYVITPDFKG